MLANSEFLSMISGLRQIATTSAPITAEIRTFVHIDAPGQFGGWIACDGRALYKNMFPDLFKAIQFAYTGEDEFLDPQDPGDLDRRSAFRVPSIDDAQNQQGQIPIRHYIQAGRKDGTGEQGPAP